METLVFSKFNNMEKIKILCLGNNLEDTAIRAAVIADQHQIQCNGLLQEHTIHVNTGCYYTDIGSITIDYLRSVCKNFDLVILLDQNPLSYNHIDSFYHSMNMCLFLKHQQRVIIQHDKPWCYMVTHFRPTNGDSLIITVKSNQDLHQQVMINDLTKRNIILQLSHISNDSFYDFTKYINAIVQKCRQSQSKFVMFRADLHEEDPELHYHLTKLLVQFREFILLTPNTFGSNVNSKLEKIILQHWSTLYE